jgi:hypothetical protein
MMFSYFNEKGNPYFAREGLLVCISRMIKDLVNLSVKDKGKIMSLNSIIGRLEPYHFFLRYKSGLISYDEVRNFIVKNVRSEEYHIPNAQVIHSEIERVLSLVLTGRA